MSGCGRLLCFPVTNSALLIHWQDKYQGFSAVTSNRRSLSEERWNVFKKIRKSSCLFLNCFRWWCHTSAFVKIQLRALLSGLNFNKYGKKNPVAWRRALPQPRAARIMWEHWSAPCLSLWGYYLHIDPLGGAPTLSLWDHQSMGPGSGCLLPSLTDPTFDRSHAEDRADKRSPSLHTRNIEATARTTVVLWGFFCLLWNTVANWLTVKQIIFYRGSAGTACF